MIIKSNHFREKRKEKKRTLKCGRVVKSEMTSSTLLTILKLLIIFLCAAWISLWILKPTQAWTIIWKHAEQSANNTIFGYYGTHQKISLSCHLFSQMLNRRSFAGLNFAVYTFPIIAIAIIGLLFLDLKGEYQRTR